jgi:Predicted membrane protein involved in D-alanine export
MVFSSLPFLFFFFPIFLIIYFIVPNRIKNIILLIFSLIFYAWGEPIYIVLMIFSSVVDYTNGRLIEKYYNNKIKKRIFLILSVIINLSLLGFFKYSNFLIENFNYFVGTNIDLLKLSLPIGISFYTFQTMSYSIDVYRGKVKASHNFLDFMTYVCMFPQLIAGPIVRYEDVEKELHVRNHNYDNFYNGIYRFVQGLFKKVLVANNIGMLFETISVISDKSMLLCWLGAIAFALQIYFDFSGYSDMAIGMGKIMGFNYPENFNYPYTATSITDFWRRWHMTLSSWFKDYLYIPIGGSRVSKLFNIKNLFVVWILTGFWHGANWNFIIWGLYFGILLILEKFVLNKFLEKLPNWLKRGYTLFLIIISWVIFAFDDVSIGKEYFSSMFNFKNIIDNNFIYYFKEYFIILIVAIFFTTPFYKKYLAIIGKNSKIELISNVVCLVTMIILFIVAVSSLIGDTYNPFMYFRF